MTSTTLEAEQAVLGALMLDGESWPDVAEILSAEDFERPANRTIFRAIQKLAADAQPLDLVTVAEALEAAGRIDQCGGLGYLVELRDSTASAANIAAYAAIIRKRSIRRQLRRAGESIIELATAQSGREDADLVDRAEKLVFEIAEQQSRGGCSYRPLNEYMVKALDRIDHLYERADPITGVPTGFVDLDSLTGGLHPGDLDLVAARPMVGKTSFALNIAENAALTRGTRVAIFSLEMPGEQLAMRMMSSIGRIDQHNVRTGKLSDEDWPRLTSAVGTLSGRGIIIDDTSALTPTELRARCRRIAREHGLDLVIVDYIQLMRSAERHDNREREVAEISRSLKALAKELAVPVLALSQLSREAERRRDHRPTLADLRDSGALEQDADMVWFLYRDELYDRESPDRGTAEVIIAKHRNGPTGDVRLAFIGKYTRFENLAPGWQAQAAPKRQPEKWVAGFEYK